MYIYIYVFVFGPVHHVGGVETLHGHLSKHSGCGLLKAASNGRILICSIWICLQILVSGWFLCEPTPKVCPQKRRIQLCWHGSDVACVHQHAVWPIHPEGAGHSCLFRVCRLTSHFKEKQLPHHFRRAWTTSGRSSMGQWTPFGLRI